MTRNRITKFIAVCSLVLGLLFSPKVATAQVAQAGPQSASLTHIGNMYFAQAYSAWSGSVQVGNTVTGSATITVLYGNVTLPDGRLFVPYNTNVPLRVIDGANSETVTPTSVSNCTFSLQQNVCNVTASFANTHSGSGASLVSGDFGIEEAMLDAGNNGGGLVFWQVDTGIVTLNTSGLTTTTSVSIPTSYISIGASARVTTTITTSANWSVGISGATASLCAVNSTLTAGTTCTPVASGLTGTSTAQPALGAVLFTMGTSNPGAGAIKARVWGFTAVSANS